jgi:hypothetical protein
VFDWNNSQNGRLLGFIGILSTLLQGGYVRRALARTGELKMAQRGVVACVLSLIIMSSLSSMAENPQRLATAIRLMYLAAALLAFTSATVVNSLTALASLQCDDDNNSSSAAQKDPQLAKGRSLGEFRSSGQLGRAIGPILACALYWTAGAKRCCPILNVTDRIDAPAGPMVTYGACGFLMFVLATHMRRIVTGKVYLKLSSSNHNARADTEHSFQKRKAD